MGKASRHHQGREAAAPKVQRIGLSMRPLVEPRKWMAREDGGMGALLILTTVDGTDT